MAHATTPRGAWIRAGLAALKKGGPEAVRIEALATSLGVTKGGFYGYFAGREALLEEMLDTWEHEAARAILDRTEADGGDAADRLGTLARLVQDHDTANGAGLELAIRDWGRRDVAVAERLARIDRSRLTYLHTLLREVTHDDEEAAVRAVLVSAVWMASHLMSFDVAGRDHAEVSRLIYRRMIDE